MKKKSRFRADIARLPKCVAPFCGPRESGSTNPIAHNPINFERTMTQSKRILAVLVIYKRRAEDSPAYVTLRQLLEGGEPSAAIDLMLADNSPVMYPPPEGFSGIYLSDLSNPGLAKHYNTAFQIAEQREIPWLMLLDQDTVLTREYLEELLSQLDMLIADQRIVAVVPKLHNGRQICSPHGKPSWVHKSVPAEQWGRSESILHAFNSGAVLRVKALRRIGGFSEEFPIEYLDCATFSELQENGDRLYVMKSMLRHDLAMTNPRTGVTLARYKNILHAEWAFYTKYGTPSDRFYLRVRLLKKTLRFLFKDRYPLIAYLAFRAAIQCRRQSDDAPV